MKRKISLETRGMWFAVVSGLLYGLLAYFGITLMRSGMSVYCLTFWRFVIAFIVVAIVIVLRKDKPSTTMSAALKTMLNGALFYSGCGIFFFLAAKYISSGEAMVIFFVYPLWVMILIGCCTASVFKYTIVYRSYSSLPASCF